jgi:hypothetical protein
VTLNTTPRTWVAGEVVTAAEMNTEVRDAVTGIQAAWATYTPALTASGSNPTLGTGSSVNGSYNQIGKTIIGEADIIFGTAGFAAGTGVYEISMPVAPISGSTGTGIIAGSGVFFDASGTTFSVFQLRWQTSSTCRMIYHGGGTGLSATAPVVPAINDRIHCIFMYQAA